MTRLIFYNIEYLEGLTGNKMGYLEFWKRFVHPKDIELHIADALKEYNPDIVAFTEVCGKSFVEGDSFMHIRKELGMRHYVKRVKYDERGLFSVFKHIPILNGQSNAIISKPKLSEPKTIYLHEGVKRAVIKVEVDLGKKVTLLLAHLALGEKTRQKQICELTAMIKRIKNPVILAGDFNTFNGEREIRKLLHDDCLEHDFRIHGGKGFTYPTFHPRKRFDYILTSQGIHVKDYKVLKLGFSDHLPVMIDFEVKHEKTGKVV